MKKITAASLFLFISVFFISCAMSSYTKTGKEYPPLAEDADVDVIMRAIPEYKVQQIGIVEVRCGLETHCIQKAIKVARQKGGNVVVLAEAGHGYSVNGGAVSQYQIRTYEICRKIEDQK